DLRDARLPFVRDREAHRGVHPARDGVAERAAALRARVPFEARVAVEVAVVEPAVREVLHASEAGLAGAVREADLVLSALPHRRADAVVRRARSAHVTARDGHAAVAGRTLGRLARGGIAGTRAERVLV